MIPVVPPFKLEHPTANARAKPDARLQEYLAI